MNKKKIVIIVIGVVILALIAGVLYYLFHRQEVGLNKKDVWKQVGVDHFEYPIKSSDYENGDVNWDINRNTKDNAINVTVDVNVSDADALYEAMKEMSENDEKRVYLTKNARESVASRFDCQIVRRALYDFYASLE